MTVVNINLTDVSGYSPSRGDAVIFEAPQVRGGSKGQVVSTAPVRVELKNGTGTVDLEPGPAIVTIAARAYRGKRTFDGVIPDNGPVAFLRVIEGEFTYQPAILSEVSRLMMAASDAARNADADAAAAKASAAEAKTSELNALSYKDTVVTSAAAAKTSETSALSAASAAADSRDIASASAAAAKTSENNAAASAASAKASETAAKTSETSAAASAASAKASETTVSASAAAAKTSETNAAASAAAAETSETNAAASATAAKTSETNAETSETNAKASQAAAATSATNAKTSETNAKTSETNAAASASAAKTDADRAKTEADRVSAPHTHKTDDVTDAVSTIGGAENANRLVKTGADGQVKLATANIRESADLVNKEYVDSATTGIASSGHKHTSADITDSQYVATASNAGKLVRIHTDGHIQDDSAPTVDNHLANKGYVDTKAPSVHKHVSADITDSQYVASTANAGKLVRVHTDGHIQDDSAPTVSNHLANKGYVDTKAPSVHKHVSADITDAISHFGSSAFADKLVRTDTEGHLSDGNNPTNDNHLARKGYVDAEVAKKATIGDFPQARILLAGVDLNTITESGTWMQSSSANATLALNYPLALAGLLEVENYGDMTLQRYTLYNTGVTYVRNRYGSLWFGWRELAFARHTHTLANITNLPNVATPSNTANSIATRNANGILSVSAPMDDDNAANKAYVDAQDAKQLPATEVESTTQILASKVPRRTSTKQLQVDVNPVSANDLTRKAYVDAQITSTANKIPKIQVVTALPASPDPSTIYMVKES